MVALWEDRCVDNHFFVTNLTASAESSKTNTKLQIRPIISPCTTKNVRSSRSGIEDFMEACSHHGVGFSIFPDGLMIAEIPVLAQRAIALRVSIALSEA